MKRTVLFAAALSALAPAAFAYAPNQLTTAQVQAISNALTSGDGSGIGAYIYSVLNW